MSEYKPARQPDSNPSLADTGSGPSTDTKSSFTDKTNAAVDRVEASAHRGTDKTADTAKRAAKQAAERGREALDSAKAHASDWMDSACNYVRDKPTQSVVMAVAAGWLLGHLLRKR